MATSARAVLEARDGQFEFREIEIEIEIEDPRADEVLVRVAATGSWGQTSVDHCPSTVACPADSLNSTITGGVINGAEGPSGGKARTRAPCRPADGITA